MSRELKFRAWSKSKKEFIAEGFTLLGEMLSTGALLCTCFENGVDIDDLEITQWTGFVDSKGVDIYEGDILKTSGYLNVNQFTKEEMVTVVYEPGRYIISSKSGETLIMRTEIEHHVTVIGNIYQTAEYNARGNV